MILAKYEKQPLEVKDYDVDYTPWLTTITDTLASLATSVVCLTDATDETLEVDSTTFSDDTVKVWISGGTDGEQYKLTLRVTTTGGRVDESELIFRVRDR